MVVCGAVWYFALKSFPRPVNANVTRNQSTKMTVKGVYIRVAVILALLVLSAWATKGGPWLPRLIGASMLVLFLIGTLRVVPHPSNLRVRLLHYSGFRETGTLAGRFPVSYLEQNVHAKSLRSKGTKVS